MLALDYLVTAVSDRDDAAGRHRPAFPSPGPRQPAVANTGSDKNRVVRRAELITLPEPVGVVTQHLDRACPELRLVEMESPLENTADAAQRGGSDNPLGRGANAHQQVSFAARSAQRARDVTVANQPQSRADRTDFGNQPLVARPLQNNDFISSGKSN